MKKKEIEDLLDRYNTGDVNEAEIALVETWYLRYKDQESDLMPDQLMDDQKESLKKLIAHIHPGHSYRLWIRVAAAAVILVTLSAGLLFYLNNRHTVSEESQNLAKYDVAPGGNKAILTLADGSRISLTDAGNGKLAQQEGIIITKTADGQLVYNVDRKNKISGHLNPKDIVLNTIETPQGGQYQIVLPDGTMAWLNSASSLKYPAVFSGNERKVELTGEAYFEVAHNPKKPFRVISNNQVVEVLGTHFNINSYTNEPATKTTLLEGSVRVVYASRHPELNPEFSSGSGPRNKKENDIVLKPGQQSILNANAINIIPVDTETVVAWKNGDFIFSNEELQSIMRKVARWYDVEIVYEKIPVGLRFDGWVSRSKNVSAVLKMMESTGKVHFKVEGRRVTVMP